ncbi:MAG: hypothetical protein NZ932_03910 [Candidatus Bathyarchaeota archaeon]|nr:hypothetical protein [Candidatus Bathyarchaeota archaeon]MDW8022387.1 hypothetical protein [Nitrososphaerota archaeon]
MSKECKRIQRNRLLDISNAVAEGLMKHMSPSEIIREVDKLNQFWREGLEMSECPTELDVDTAVVQLKRALNALAV